MATTQEARALTVEHQAQQIALRAASYDDLVKLWRALDVTNLADSIEVLAQAVAIVAEQGYGRSASLALRYFRLFRVAERVPGNAPSPVAATPLARTYIEGQIRGAALNGIITARRAGLTIPQARERGLVRVAGTLGKLILTGGRMTLVGMAQRDPVATGWQRVTTGNPCAFCRMLASRGPAYKTARSADFESHDHCGCTSEVVYRGDEPNPQAAEYAREWAAAQKAAREDGTASTKTSNNALNNYRRYLAGGGTSTGSGSVNDGGNPDE